MAFYGSTYSNEKVLNDGRQLRPARHIACPRSLKYIHNIRDGYIPYVEDSVYISPSANENALKRTNRFGLYNTMHDWRQELMGLARQVQSSLVLNESHQSRSARSIQHRSRRPTSSKPNSRLNENYEQNISKRLLNRRYQLSPVTKSKIPIDNNERESSINNENQDSGIWLLPILCHILHVDNINEAQDWLVNANLTEKRLAMELMSRTMQDMQNHENSFISDMSSYDQSLTSSNLNNLYWPYKFWQHQQSKLIIDNNDTCERATSPVRILSPIKRLSTSTTNDRTSMVRYDRTPQKNLTSNIIETWRPSSRYSTPMSPNNNDRLSRRSSRITTSRSISTDNDNKLMSTNFHGKTPRI
ncbi:unnamed protein product [Rotaria sordida]|uniref:Uncharacterized protein n=1 Tax=Rotaria sordida TaxID=392033 RepID=A0A813P429_9BILA|nr:unnamed protein product [Rotaria sordida]CAF0933522.1 unnamed protein product [Rotaria sordida]